MSNVKSLIFIVILLAAIIYCIGQIIDLARESNRTPTLALITDMQNHPDMAIIDSALSSNRMLNYKALKSKINNKDMIANSLGLEDSIGALPMKDQDTMIRLKLLEWKIDFISKEIVSAKPESMFNNISFYIFTALIGLLFIPLERCVSRYSDDLINKYLKLKQS